MTESRTIRNLSTVRVMYKPEAEKFIRAAGKCCFVTFPGKYIKEDELRHCLTEYRDVIRSRAAEGSHHDLERTEDFIDYFLGDSTDEDSAIKTIEEEIGIGTNNP